MDQGLTQTELGTGTKRLDEETMEKVKDLVSGHRFYRNDQSLLSNDTIFQHDGWFCGL